METIGDITKWLEDDGENTYRLNYNLNKDSIIFNLGAYGGSFTEEIYNKYKSKIYCFEPMPYYYELMRLKFYHNKNIIISPYGITAKNEKRIIYFNEDSSSLFIKTDMPFEIECVTLDNVMSKYNIEHIDLIKINIEGGEFFLLDDMIIKGLHMKCDNIQVQFHIFIENYDDRYKNIKWALEKTHHLTYRYPYVWENWEKN